MQYLDTNQNTMYRVYMWRTKNTDGRNESFSFFNGTVCHVYILEDSILLRCQLSLTWFISLMKSPWKYQEAKLLISKNRL